MTYHSIKGNANFKNFLDIATPLSPPPGPCCITTPRAKLLLLTVQCSGSRCCCWEADAGGGVSVSEGIQLFHEDIGGSREEDMEGNSVSPT